VRRGPDGAGTTAPRGDERILAEPGPEAAPAAPPAVADEGPVPKSRGRWAKWAVVSLLVGTFAALGVGGWFAFSALRKNEASLAREAEGNYKAGLYRDAKDRYTQLVADYPQSEDLPRYAFMKDLSELRWAVADPQDDVPALLDRVEAFVRDHADHALLPEYAPDVGQALVKVLTEFSQRATANPDDKDLPTVERGRAALQLVDGIPGAKALSQADREGAKKLLDGVVQAVARKKRRLNVLDQLAALAGKGDYPAIRRARQVLRDEEAHLPGIGQDPDVIERMNELYQAHVGSVRYLEGPGPARRRGQTEEGEAGILFAPLLGEVRGDGRDGRIVLALARGVLYALEQGSGNVRWALRVGVDTTALPVRVPATDGSLERILVLSSDTETLTAWDVDGNVQWRYRLSKPCLGRPVVVGQRAYLPTYDGQVHAIELAQGKVLGRYQLGQRLTVGGTAQPGTDLVYFPADDSCVYVLDVKERRCRMVLYSGHPSGSLRSEPLIVASEEESAPSYLILNQTDGLHAMRLRVFDLPLKGRHAAERALSPEPRLGGWTWFQPKLDPEKLALLSDTGALGLFGIRQARNNDKALFPLLPGGPLDLPALLKWGPAPRARAEVVQMLGDDLWVLAAGRLCRLRLGWGQDVGPKLVRAWPKHVEDDLNDLGAPLHASQAVEDPLTGRSTLFLVTQPARRRACWATAVLDEDGTVRWRRQLGLVCQGEPLLLAPPGGGLPVVLVQDQAGGLFGLAPERFRDRGDGQWLRDPNPATAMLADSLDDNPDVSPLLLPGPDGHSAYAVACPGAGTELVVRHLRFAPGGGPQEISKPRERKARLRAPLGGTPAVVGDRLVLPLANGELARLPWPLPEEAAVAQSGRNWRARRADPGARGHVLALGDDRFLVTDGARGLTCWRWPAGAGFSKLHHLDLPDRIVTAPLALPPSRPGGPRRLCVADSGGRLVVLRVRPNGRLEEERSWALGGQAVGAPFLRSLPDGTVRVGCVVEVKRPEGPKPGQAESHLVWVALGDGGRQVYKVKGDVIVGQPQLAGGLLVVGHQSGLLRGLDPETLRPVGPGYRLRGSVAPAATPVPFGPGRLLVLLSDGTGLLLPLDRVHHPLRKFPTAW
jgi:hypothetical protein